MYRYRVDAHDLKVVKVPENYRECSVCGHWLPPESNSEPCRRTNCDACYTAPMEKFNKLRDKTNANKKRKTYDNLCELADKLNSCQTKRALMEKITKALAAIPDDELVLLEHETFMQDYDETTFEDDVFDTEAQAIDATAEPALAGLVERFWVIGLP